MSRRLTICAAALLAAAPLTAAGAQAARRPRAGVVVGVASSKFTGSNVSGAESHSGPVIGGRFAVPLAGALWVIPEVVYVRKGSRLVDPTGSAELRLGYIEFPVLVSLVLPPAGAVTPRVYAGPALAARVVCDVDITTAGQSVAGSCDDTNGTLGGNLLDVQSLDASAIVGGELALALARRHAVVVGARFERGLSRITSGSDARNSSFAVTAGYEFRLR